MTQNTTSHNAPLVTNIDFLKALYTQPQLGLWLELRCIHPETGEVRSLWSHSDNPKQLAAILKQTDRLNKEGFGIYFAPCLRREKKGNAAAAALLPALWVDIDCENDSKKREQGLTKLCTFDPPPSVILDSGGGWHGYWLLQQPFELLTDDHKQKISQIQHGLFAALDAIRVTLSLSPPSCAYRGVAIPNPNATRQR